MTCRALNLGADVRRVLEAHVRFRKVAVDAVPVEIDALGLHLGDLLDQRPIGGNLRVAGHAGVDARQPRAWPLLDPSMAVGTDGTVVEVNLMGKGKGLRDVRRA